MSNSRYAHRYGKHKKIVVGPHIFVIIVGLKSMYSGLDRNIFFPRKGKVKGGRRHVKKSLPTFSSQGQGGIMWFRVWHEKNASCNISKVKALEIKYILQLQLQFS